MSISLLVDNFFFLYKSGGNSFAVEKTRKICGEDLEEKGYEGLL